MWQVWAGDRVAMIIEGFQQGVIVIVGLFVVTVRTGYTSFTDG